MTDTAVFMERGNAWRTDSGQTPDRYWFAGDAKPNVAIFVFGGQDFVPALRHRSRDKAPDGFSNRHRYWKHEVHFSHSKTIYRLHGAQRHEPAYRSEFSDWKYEPFPDARLQSAVADGEACRCRLTLLLRNVKKFSLRIIGCFVRS
jgi:hypothetical protein